MPYARPDFSEYVGHFTKDAVPIVADDIDPANAAAVTQPAFDRLVNILRMGRILATAMPWCWPV